MPMPPRATPPTPPPPPPDFVKTLVAMAARDASSMRLLTSSIARVAASMARASCSASVRSWAWFVDDIKGRSSSERDNKHLNYEMHND